jgi:hypothetical protein
MTQPGPEPGAPGSAPEPTPEPEAQLPPSCPWCGARVADGVPNCGECGAAVAQRESIGGLKIPGLTSVDPALEDFDKRPLHLRGPSPSQGVAPALIIGAAAGGPIGLVAIGGVAAVAAAELLGSTHDGPAGIPLADVGKPSEVLLQALARAEARDDEPPDVADASEPVVATHDGQPPDAAAADGGRSIWRDLPPPPDAPEGSV